MRSLMEDDAPESGTDSCTNDKRQIASGYRCMLGRGSVAVTIVTYNSRRFIRRCLEGVLNQKYWDKKIVVVDNGSTDGSAEVLKQFEDRVHVIRNRENLGFAAAQNQAIAWSGSEWVLVLNPDVLLMPDFLAMMVAAGEADDSIGSVSGKLMRMSAEFEIPDRPIIDSTGIYFTPTLRHLDRGSCIVDDGRYDDFEYVFGASGAAALYRRAMIEDSSLDGEFFDSDFFVYREDADVAWRAQLFGWKCLYTPRAVAYHVRSVLPENRSTLPAAINMHSVKNRYLLRVKNMTNDLYRRNWFAITLRDGVVLTACLVRELNSLRAFPLVASCYPRLKEKRHKIMKKRRVSDAYMAAWFSYEPVSYPASHLAPKAIARETMAAR